MVERHTTDVNKNNLKKGAPNRNHSAHQFIHDKRYRTYVNMFAFYMFSNCRYSRVSVWRRNERRANKRVRMSEWTGGCVSLSVCVCVCLCTYVALMLFFLNIRSDLHFGIQFNIVTELNQCEVMFLHRSQMVRKHRYVYSKTEGNILLSNERTKRATTDKWSPR